MITSFIPKSYFLFFNVYLPFVEREREHARERDRAQAGEGQREGEIQNPKQAPDSELSAQSPMRGSKSQTVRS